MGTVESRSRVSVDPSRFRLAADGQAAALVGTRCAACGEYHFGTLRQCRNCTSADIIHVALSGTGTLYSYTTVRRVADDWQGPVPYVLGLVQLAESPLVLSELIGCAEADLAVGLPVRMAARTVGTAADGAEIIGYKWEPLSAGRREP